MDAKGQSAKSPRALTKVNTEDKGDENDLRGSNSAALESQFVTSAMPIGKSWGDDLNNDQS
jgi:hypothetical protein